MAKLKTKAARDKLLQAVRRERLNYIAILPSLITILNGLCGFASIVLASNDKFVLSAYMLFLAMIADMLDGRVARMSKSTSSFGGQLDSLCDMISFGLAPAFLMLKITQYKFTNFVEMSASLEGFLQRFIWLAAAAYISCAAIRLARFNVENEEEESAHMSFIGLPTPAAAGVVVSLVLLHQQIFKEFYDHNPVFFRIGGDIIVFSLPFLVFFSAILMVSRIRYPHVVNQYLKGKKPFAYFLRVLVVIGLVIWSTQVAFVLIFCGFAASGFLKWFYLKFFRRKRESLEVSAQSSC